MKNSLTKSTTRAPLAPVSASNNSLTKSSSSVQKNTKPTALSRQSSSTTKPSLLGQNSAKPSPVLKQSLSQSTSKPPSYTDLPEVSRDPSPQDHPVNEPFQKQPSLKQIPQAVLESSHREEIVSRPQTVRQRSETYSDVNVLIKDHESCFEKQKDLVAQFKTENDMQSEDISKLRAEITRWKESVAKVEQEVVSLKEKNMVLGNMNTGHDDTILNLRREILLLQRKVEHNHDSVSNSQLEVIKLKREISDLKGDKEELRALVLKERNEKEGFWNQLQEESKRYNGLLDTNIRFKDESSSLVHLVEAMRDEMKLLRSSNEEALKYIMNK